MVAAERRQWRQPADQLQELSKRIDAIEATIEALVADRKWIVSAIANLHMAEAEMEAGR